MSFALRALVAMPSRLARQCRYSESERHDVRRESLARRGASDVGLRGECHLDAEGFSYRDARLAISNARAINR
jgi:hypothetical protein